MQRAARLVESMCGHTLSGEGCGGSTCEGLSTVPHLLGDLGHVRTILHTSAPAGFFIKKDAWRGAGADEIFVILN